MPTDDPFGHGDISRDEDMAAQEPKPVARRLVAQALTYEHLVWAALAVLAAAMRLWFIDVTPLNNTEARVALQSYGLATLGSGVLNNPLFGNAQSWLFTLTHADEFTARLISALAGVALCLLPTLLRTTLGRGRALALGGLLAFSPTVWFASRQADGALLAWVLAFAFFIAWRVERINLSAVLLGLLVACGVDGISPIIVCVIVIVATGDLRSIALTPRFGLIALVTLVLASTGLLLHPAGFGNTFSGLAAWFARMTETGSMPLARALLGLLVYELPLIAGMLGAIAMLIVSRQIDRAEMQWLGWLGAGFILLVLTRGRSAADVIPLVIGMSGLAARIIDWLFSHLQRHGQWGLDGSYIAVLFIVYICAGLGLRQYASTGEASWLMLGLLALVLSGAAITSSGMLGDMGIGVRGVVAALTINLLLYSVATGAHLVWDRAANPAEPYVSDAAPLGLHNLAETVQLVSTRSQGDPQVMKVQVQRSAPPALLWALRNQTEVQVTDNTGDEGVIITPDKAPPTARGNSGYVGNGFVIESRVGLDSVRCSRSETNLNCVPLARWWAFRQADAPTHTRWVLWVRGDVANKASGVP